MVSGLATLMPMPPTSRSAPLSDVAGDATVAVVRDSRPEKYVDVDTIKNSDRLVAVFSQRSWDGGITFGIHRTFDRYNHNDGDWEEAKTTFIPEDLSGSFSSFIVTAMSHLEKLKAKRDANQLPFPKGGLKARHRP